MRSNDRDAVSTSAGETLLQVRDLRFERPNGLLVLDDINLDIRAGEVVAVIGPSGCGKSTLLSLLAGLLHPTTGSIERSSGTISGSERERWLTLMFQDETLLPWRTVAKNVGFGLERLGVPRTERDRRVAELLAMVSLDSFAGTRPLQLSGGMRRRAQFAACVAPLPRLLLLDEPFSALDEPTRVSLHADVLKVIYELNIGVVLVTHDIAEAISLADRVVVLSQRPGRINEILEVPLGHDRDVYTVRETETYGELYRRLWHQIWSTHERGASDAGAADPAVGAGAGASGEVA